jgi:hypothetical protein
VLKLAAIAFGGAFLGCTRNPVEAPSKDSEMAVKSIDPSDPEATPAGRIVFPGSPWPRGHEVKAFRWSARIDEDSGLWFDLHLDSARYNAEDAADERDDDRDDVPNWESKIVWNNYGACILSSDYWWDGGFRPAEPGARFNFDTLAGREFHVDPLPVDQEVERAFGIYLQGHDTTADHRIKFRRPEPGGPWSITWSGKIELDYLGGEGFDHEFRTRIEGVEFEGIVMPRGIAGDPARRLLARHVVDPGSFAMNEEGESAVFQPGWGRPS